MNMKIHEVQITPNRVKIKRTSLRHSIIKFSKIRDQKNLKAAREKELITHKRTSFTVSEIARQKHCRPGESGMVYSKCQKEKTTVQQEYYNSKAILQK